MGDGRMKSEGTRDRYRDNKKKRYIQRYKQKRWIQRQIRLDIQIKQIDQIRQIDQINRLIRQIDARLDRWIKQMDYLDRQMD